VVGAARAPVAMFQRTTAGTLNTNVHRLTMICIGIDLATGFARQAFGVKDDAGEDDEEVLCNE
jgi:hypothetical protein